jgi:hypothetical protein
MSKFYVGDVGTLMLVDTKTDIFTATVIQLKLRKPSGEELTWDGVLGPIGPAGTYTTISYIIQTGDWDEPGWWTVQAYIEMPGWKGLGETVKFKLEPEFK